MFLRTPEITTFSLLAKGLETSSLRHRVIADNIANVNTPLFKRKIVRFEDEMNSALQRRQELPGQRTDTRHIPLQDDRSHLEIRPIVVTDRLHSMRNDRNNVDIDQEMSDLAKNTMSYQIYATRLASLFEGLNEVITRGGRY